MNEQGTKEWLAERRGHFTSSEIVKFCKPDGIGITGITYIMETLGELVTDPETDPENFETKEMLWGKTYEPMAADVYSKEKNVTVETVGFIKHPQLTYWGGSQDRKTYDNGSANEVGTCEIKCPYNSGIHLKHRLIKSSEYFKKEFDQKYWQCVSNMIIAGVKYCDFVSFDPRMKTKELGLFVFRLHLTQEDTDFIIGRIIQARKIMIDKANEIGIEISN